MKESIDIALDTNTEKINIYLNKNTYDAYYELRKTKTFDKYTFNQIEDDTLSFRNFGFK